MLLFIDIKGSRKAVVFSLVHEYRLLCNSMDAFLTNLLK